MRRLSLAQLIGFVSALMFSGTVASAQMGEYTLSAGYSHIYTGSSPSLFYNKDGVYFDADLGWHVPFNRSPFVLGLGLTGSGYWEDNNTFNSTGTGNADFGNQNRLDSDLENFEIEPRLAFDFWIPRTPIFIKPRIGAGLLINDYDIDQAFEHTTFTNYNTAQHTGAAFEIRPALQAGVAFGPATAGLDVSYMAAWGGFGGLGNHAEELRVGAFIGFRF